MAIKTFFEYLDILEKLKKEKEYDKFWAVANQGILDLLKQKDDS